MSLIDSWVMKKGKNSGMILGLVKRLSNFNLVGYSGLVSKRSHARVSMVPGVQMGGCGNLSGVVS